MGPTSTRSEWPANRGELVTWQQPGPDPRGACRCHVPSEHSSQKSDDTLAEWLRRRPAKPMGSPRVGSNPTGVVCSHLRSLRGAGFLRDGRPSRAPAPLVPHALPSQAYRPSSPPHLSVQERRPRPPPPQIACPTATRQQGKQEREHTTGKWPR